MKLKLLALGSMLGESLSEDAEVGGGYRTTRQREGETEAMRPQGRLDT